MQKISLFLLATVAVAFVGDRISILVYRSTLKRTALRLWAGLRRQGRDLDYVAALALLVGLVAVLGPSLDRADSERPAPAVTAAR